MDFFDVVRDRRSIRSYRDAPVADEVLEQVLEAARLAPSASNRQEWKFVVVRDADLRAQLVGAARGQQFVGQAPVVIAACAMQRDHVMSCGHPSHLIDVAIALEHLALAARALELGTCWIGAFDQQKVRELLGIPRTVDVVELMTLGYPTEWPDPRDRKTLEQIAAYDGWER
jgi:nitroreductase